MYWFMTSALEEDEDTGEPLWIREGMDTGLEWMRLTGDQKDFGKGEVSKLWKNLDLGVWGKQESCYHRNGGLRSVSLYSRISGRND